MSKSKVQYECSEHFEALVFSAALQMLDRCYSCLPIVMTATCTTSIPSAGH